MLAFVAAWLFVGLGSLAAQGGDAGAATPAPVEGSVDLSQGALQSFGQLFMLNPAINGVIAALSILALMLFLFFFATISSSIMAPADFVDDVTKLVGARRFEDAANYCRAHKRTFVASVIQRCAENAEKNHSVIIEMVDAEGRRRADIMWNRISYLADISNVAPMLGLLGTVWGMIKAFFGLSEATASLGSKALTTSIGGAMSTTLFGLAVAILALVFYTVVKGRATRALADAEQAVHSIADKIKSEAQ